MTAQANSYIVFDGADHRARILCVAADFVTAKRHVQTVLNQRVKAVKSGTPYADTWMMLEGGKSWRYGGKNAAFYIECHAIVKSIGKQCCTCHTWFEDDDVAANFYRNAGTKSGYEKKCKTCFKAYQRTYSKRPDVRKRAQERHQAWVSANPDKVREYWREARLKRKLKKASTLVMTSAAREIINKRRDVG